MHLASWPSVPSRAVSILAGAPSSGWNRASWSGSAGLGLALVQRIVHEDMGGKIELQSTPGQGTTVTVRLPRQGVSGAKHGWADISATA
ncbi:MAG: ATP-binding protein [Deltaproteobacteria bacterium]|nr:ATP-binding protein [Deltaproteobacteria bacterium]